MRLGLTIAREGAVRWPSHFRDDGRYSGLVASPAVRDRMLAAGQRITPQRDLVAGVLERAGRPLSAPEIVAAVDRADEGVGRATVFRTLQSLLEAGIVQHVVLPGNQHGYLLCAAPGHHHHLICEGCGRVTDLEESEVGDFLASLERDHRFAVDHATFDIYGTCTDCRSGQPTGGLPGEPV